jgi:hypothetical protein
VAHDLASNSHPFSNVYFFTRIDTKNGESVILFPNNELIKGFDPRSFKGNRYVNFDPAAAVPFKDGDKVGVRFDLSPAAVKNFVRGPE